MCTVYHSTSTFSLSCSACPEPYAPWKKTTETHSVSRIAASSDLLFNQSMSYDILPCKTLYRIFTVWRSRELCIIQRSVPWKNYGIQEVRIRPEGMLCLCVCVSRRQSGFMEVWGNILTTLRGYYSLDSEQTLTSNLPGEKSTNFHLLYK